MSSALQSFTLPHGAIGVSGLILVSLFLVCVPSDIREFRIPNRFTYPGLAAGLGLNILLSLLHWLGLSGLDGWLGGIGLIASVTGSLICFSGMTLFFITLGCGAGDVKLMAAVGALLGWRGGAEVCLYAMLLAAAYVLLIAAPIRLLFPKRNVVVDSEIKTELQSTEQTLKPKHHRALPMAPFFAAGTACVVLVPLIVPGYSILNLVAQLP